MALIPAQDWIAAAGPEARIRSSSNRFLFGSYHGVPSMPSSTASMTSNLDKPAFALASLRREFGDEVGGMLVRLRFVIAPLPLLLGGLVIVLDATLWRRIVLGVVLSCATTLFLLYRFRRKQVEFPFVRGVVSFVGMVLHPALLIATGGVFSPIMAAMLFLAYTAGAILDRPHSLRLVCAQIASVALAAVLDFTQLIGPLIPSPFNPAGLSGAHAAWPFVVGTLGSAILFGASEIGYRFQRITIRMLDREVAARQESLRLHREQLTELTLLSGEIAHELKNPLASIKGLAALLAKRTQGPEAEPLSVLRREADRMQGILDEFLNLSRPLVPLSLAPHELSQIARDVCILHEGLAELRRVRFELSSPPDTTTVCDERKVRQILVNLIQNALDASPVGSTIQIGFSSTNDQIELTLDDEGSGIDPKIADRAFEAGVTSKQGGSGLGLNVARGLARQHGGDVLLQNREGGGCRATLSLPLVPTVAVGFRVPAQATGNSVEAANSAEAESWPRHEEKR